MIAAALLSARAWLSALPRGVKLALAAIALLALLWAAWAIWLHTHDAKVIDQHEAAINQAAAPASQVAAEDRAADALENAQLRSERDDAITKAEAVEAAKPVEQRAALPPTTVALNCARMRQAYSAAELVKVAAYKERCL
ncbi:hypothetical protein [Novosphingobium sp. Leaf2]|uniref:hypothetical protein n=1 Tax=Novosphingobium sp. Leaf2 TaxID=1735670 RepID=UPI0006F8C25B|nr:hypothetical protein [Novosphingobium sp. Leaf2]KQM18370.1 hypothetical protein ASE49_09165 [Novosphingobium sp. Leaf2]